MIINVDTKYIDISNTTGEHNYKKVVTIKTKYGEYFE